MPGMIEQLVEAAWRDLDERRIEVPIDKLEEQLEVRHQDRPFSEALVAPGVSLVAEFKRRSPSGGELKPGASVAEIVKAYERGGAAAVSVLTERGHFGGSIDDLREARSATDLPIIRKDFIVDPYMLYEAAAAGADAVLLIVAALDRDQLELLYIEAGSLDLDCLVEVHNERELEAAFEIDADVLGINNRDLSDFSVNVDTTFTLISEIPAGKTVVSESGISTREQLEEMERVGVDAVLVGEALMCSADPEEACRELAQPEEGTQA